MSEARGEREAFGQPGLEPHWTHGNKDGVGTAYSFESQCWFTLWNGVLTEVYYPTVDRPQLRDLQYLITHADNLFHEEKRDLCSRAEALSEHAPAFWIVNSDPQGRYVIIKEIVTDPLFSCVLQRTRLDGDERFLQDLQMYVLCNPHLEVGGHDNNASVVRVAGREVLAAEKGGIWMALAATDYSVLCAHEDKAYPGAIIASLSIPWGDAKGDQDRGGYHLVWVRDMVQGATALLAAGEKEPPFRALAYLSAIQQPDGGFPQNAWVSGQPYWQGIQLDEVAAPILLAWRLHREHALKEFDPYPMVMQAAAYLIHHGPVTQQERWEEASGYSPSTLAATIAAWIGAAAMARERGEEETARYLEEYADFRESHLEDWTVTTEGTLVPGIARHYIRINPASVQDPQPDEDPNHGTLTIKNRPPGSRTEFPAKEIVGPGFLALVRYGIRPADGPLIVDPLRAVDSLLRVDTPFGPCWHRYNHDGYGQREDGGPFAGWGKGRAWPLLTGERGHYELAAGRDVRMYLRAMEGFGGPTGLLPEQVWDEPDRPDIGMCLGQPTGSARPLMWAHAEYVKLLRSVHDGELFDRTPEVAQRYLNGRRGGPAVEIWKFNRRVATIQRGRTLRIQAPAAFRLHWSRNGWETREDTVSTPTRLGIEFVDIPVPERQRAPIQFTFLWPAKGLWEGRDYEVATVRQAS